MKFANMVIGALVFIIVMSMPGKCVAMATTPDADTVKVEAGVVADKVSEPDAEGKNIIQLSTYALPYPGILPDHPLYFLKTLRDKIIESLIADPVRKAEFYILQSDKYMNTAIFLQQKGKISLSIKAIEQAGSFSTLASQTLTKIKDSGKDIQGGVFDRFTRSMAKHREVLSDYDTKTTEELKDASEKALKTLETLGIEGK